MAGSLIATAREHLENSAIAIRDQWEIQFSRYLNYPSLSSTCPFLAPLSNTRRSRFRGTWLSSYTSTAYLQLVTDHSTSETVLIVHFRGRIHEEHFISKLRFSWPRLSCISGFPTRGSRVVFVSYRDCTGQIQKFALRFSTINETEAFMNALKGTLKDVRDFGLPCSDFGSEISSQSEFTPPNGPPYRAREELSFTTPADTCTHQMPLSLNYEVDKCSLSQETMLDHDFEGVFAALPPSFTSLLTNCCAEVKQAAAQPTISEEVDLKSQITRYMEDSDFQDILTKVEKVISEMGDDLML